MVICMVFMGVEFYVDSYPHCSQPPAVAASQVCCGAGTKLHGSTLSLVLTRLIRLPSLGVAGQQGAASFEVAQIHIVSQRSAHHPALAVNSQHDLSQSLLPLNPAA
jgi:hypothetical protein